MFYFLSCFWAVPAQRKIFGKKEQLFSEKVNQVLTKGFLMKVPITFRHSLHFLTHWKLISKYIQCMNYAVQDTLSIAFSGSMRILNTFTHCPWKLASTATRFSFPIMYNYFFFIFKCFRDFFFLLLLLHVSSIISSVNYFRVLLPLIFKWENFDFSVYNCFTRTNLGEMWYFRHIFVLLVVCTFPF